MQGLLLVVVHPYNPGAHSHILNGSIPTPTHPHSHNPPQHPLNARSLISTSTSCHPHNDYECRERHTNYCPNCSPPCARVSCTCVSVRIAIAMCVCVCVRICMCACVWVCWCAWMCSFAVTRACVHTYVMVCECHLHACTIVCVCACRRVCAGVSVVLSAY